MLERVLELARRGKLPCVYAVFRFFTTQANASISSRTRKRKIFESCACAYVFHGDSFACVACENQACEYEFLYWARALRLKNENLRNAKLVHQSEGRYFGDDDGSVKLIFLPLCYFFKDVTSFYNITKDSTTAKKMEELYHDKDNVDLWVGGLAEDHEEGSELGPTFRR